MGLLNKSKSGVRRSAYGDFFVFLILCLVAVFMLIPFIYAIVQAFKPMEEIFAYPPKFFVVNPTIENFYILSQLTNNMWVPFSRYIVNTAFISVVGTIITLIISSMAAFPLAKYPFPGSKIIFKIIILSLLFVGPVTSVPQYVILAKMGAINTYYAVLLPALASPLGLFLLKNFMTQINDAMIEAAKIDGANILTIYYKVVIPIVRPAILTLVILSFQGFWNNTGSGFIYDEAKKFLPTILSQIVSSGIARVGVGAAASVIMMIPPFVIFIMLQRRVIETMAHAGIK